MVFFSIAYRIKRKTAGQRLVQWEGMDDEEAPYLMKEFHEHLGTSTHHALGWKGKDRDMGVWCSRSLLCAF